MPMTDAPAQGPTAASADKSELLARLKAHRRLGSAPTAELEWLIAHGSVVRFDPGSLVARKGQSIDGMYVILTGHVSFHSDQGGAWRRIIDWREGDITGTLPYSRMTVAPGNSIVEEATDALRILNEDMSEMTTACPHVTTELVHAMLDRARAFKSSDLQVEKMASLGKLAARLAHELNNPASAAARSAELLSGALAECETAARELGAAGLDARELALIERLRASCSAMPTGVLSPIERADREEAIAGWLSDHGSDDSLAADLADTVLTLGSLDEAAAAVGPDRLRTALRWVAAGCTVRALARDIERAASRVHHLVSAVKGFTYMDRPSATAEPVDVAKGLTDTLAVMGTKARGKSASLTIDVPADLPRVRGFGGELNQVWANLLDNALDAVKEGGSVRVTARADGSNVVVRVTDDGHGIPAELKGQIFEPFFTTKPVGEGTGLGLDIVRRLVDSHAGLLDVESEPGHTEFRVTLPVAK